MRVVRVLFRLSTGETKMKVDNSQKTKVCMRVVSIFIAAGQKRMRVGESQYIPVDGLYESYLTFIASGQTKMRVDESWKLTACTKLFSQ